MMIRKSIFLFLSILFSMPFFYSCEREEDMLADGLPLRTPFQVWEFEGFATVNKNNSQSASLSNTSSYSLVEVNSTVPLILSLTQERTFTGNTPSHKISGEFTYDPSRGTFSFTSFYPENLVEQGDGARYLSSLKSVSSYAILMISNSEFEQKLRLYYTKDKTRFLLFSAVK